MDGGRSGWVTGGISVVSGPQVRISGGKERRVGGSHSQVGFQWREGGRGVWSDGVLSRGKERSRWMSEQREE